jgi:hypothetical protein
MVSLRTLGLGIRPSLFSALHMISNFMAALPHSVQVYRGNTAAHTHCGQCYTTAPDRDMQPKAAKGGQNHLSLMGADVMQILAAPIGAVQAGASVLKIAHHMQTTIHYLLPVDRTLPSTYRCWEFSFQPPKYLIGSMSGSSIDGAAWPAGKRRLRIARTL